MKIGSVGSYAKSAGCIDRAATGCMEEEVLPWMLCYWASHQHWLLAPKTKWL